MRSILTLIAWSLVASFAAAQTSYPMITHIMPVAVQRGKTAEIAVEGQMSFQGVYKALIDGTGISTEAVSAANSSSRGSFRRRGPRGGAVKLKVTVAPKAPLGVRELRVASSLGISSVGQLVVVDDPVVQESGFNNTMAQANPIPVPCVACGRIEAPEDVDFFKFHADAGQAFTFEVLCARLEDKIHDLQKHADPMLTLYDAEGRELASNDDFYFADPLLEYTIPKTGDYFLQIRDSKYDGDARWVYAIHVTNRPYASNVYPMAGNPGKEIEVEPVGSAKLKQGRVKLRVPAAPGLQEVRLDLGGVQTNPVPFVVSTLPQVVEQEPNDTPAQATRITLPCGINGRIAAPRDLDYFIFKAAKGRAIRFEVKARRFGTSLHSSLDSVLDIMNAKGDVLANNDDTFGKDASLVFMPPADGDYYLRIRDLNSKGGANAVYFIEADWALPDFTLRCDPDKAMLGPGSSAAWHVHVSRANGFAGPVRIDVKGLPKGVVASPLTIPPTMTQGLVVLTAAADAPRDAAPVQFFGSGTIKLRGNKEETIQRPVTPEQEYYSPGGGRGVFEVNHQVVAVTQPSDILKVEVMPKTITLQPGQEVRLDVSVQRRPDYTKDISLDVMLRHLGQVFGNPLPPGVTMVESKSKTLLGTGSKGHIVLKAEPTAAPIENVPISVQAFVSINFVVKVSHSSPPIPLSIRK
jgi:hypothetical protein